MSTLSLVVVIVALALLFDYFNGYNDAANSIATVVATRVLTPLQAVIWAASFNFLAAFTFGTEVARTVGAGLVNLDLVTPYVILAGLAGAIFWIWLTSHLGLPVSASHTLYGGYAGAAISRTVAVHGWENAFDAVIWSGWVGPVVFIVLSPLLGTILASALMIGIYWGCRGLTPKQMDKHFRRLQLVSAAVFSYSHGSNDAQKTMGIITGALVTAGYLQTFEVPLWVMLSAYSMISLGTLMGGWRVIATMGHKITKLRPREGFAAEAAGATSVLFATYLGQPVSTTHTIAGAIAGVGLVKRARAVRWKVARKIFWAWILTIPASALVGFLAFQLTGLFLREL